MAGEAVYLTSKCSGLLSLLFKTQKQVLRAVYGLEGKTCASHRGPSGLGQPQLSKAPGLVWSCVWEMPWEGCWLGAQPGLLRCVENTRLLAHCSPSFSAVFCPLPGPQPRLQLGGAGAEDWHTPREAVQPPPQLCAH